MTRLFEYLTIGTINGLLYGLLALGIVLIYKGSRILNFAQTSFALVSAFFAWYFVADAPFLPFAENSRPRYLIAIVLALALSALNGYGIEHGVIRRLRGAPRLTLLVATVAISTGNAGIVLVLFGRTEEQQNTARALPSIVKASFTIGGYEVRGGAIETLVLVPLVCAGLALFFTRTRFGIAVRAAADNGDAARLLGISAAKVSVFTWVTGAALAGLAGLLITEHRGSLDAASLSTGFLIASFTAALVGGLTSLPGAIVGGLVVGLLQAMTQLVFSESTKGAPEMMTLVLVIAILVVRPGGIFGKPEDTEDKVAFVASLRSLPEVLRDTVASASFTVMGAMSVVFVGLLALVTGPSTNSILAHILILGIAGISLTVLIGYTGQISLGHWGLAGFGGYVAALCVSEYDLPWIVGVVAAVIAGGALAFVLGLPALRIRGLYLAIVTLAFHQACQSFIYQQMSPGTASVALDKPRMLGIDFDAQDNRAFTLLCMVLLLVCGWVTFNLIRSRAGRSFLSARENEKAAATLGVDLPKAKLQAFVVSGALIGLAGALEATRQSGAQPSSFEIEVSFQLVSMVVIGGLGSIPGAVLGALLVFGLPELLSFLNAWVVALGTATLLFVTVTRAPGGAAGVLQTIRDRTVRAVAELDPVTRRRVAEVTGPAGAAGSQ